MRKIKNIYYCLLESTIFPFLPYHGRLKKLLLQYKVHHVKQKTLKESLKTHTHVRKDNTSLNNTESLFMGLNPNIWIHQLVHHFLIFIYQLSLFGALKAIDIYFSIITHKSVYSMSKSTALYITVHHIYCRQELHTYSQKNSIWDLFFCNMMRNKKGSDVIPSKR